MVSYSLQRTGSRMRLTRGRGTWLLSICLTIGGCASPAGARYVYQDGEFGVVGIPCNTLLEKNNYRSQADVLMARHFPRGYEIVRADEVVEGQRTLDHGNRTEIDAGATIRATNQLINLAKLGRTTSYEEKDQLQLRECRIIYKRKSAGTDARPIQFAAVASLTPQFNVNPNEALCHHADGKSLAKAGPAPKHVTDTGSRSRRQVGEASRNPG